MSPPSISKNKSPDVLLLQTGIKDSFRVIYNLKINPIYFYIPDREA
jgi:hypothetical protein